MLDNSPDLANGCLLTDANTGTDGDDSNGVIRLITTIRDAYERYAT